MFFSCRRADEELELCLLEVPRWEGEELLQLSNLSSPAPQSSQPTTAPPGSHTSQPERKNTFLGENIAGRFSVAGVVGGYRRRRL